MDNMPALPCTFLLKDKASKGDAWEYVIDQIKKLGYVVLDQAKNSCYFFTLVVAENAEDAEQTIIITSIYRSGNSNEWWISCAFESDVNFMLNNFHSRAKNMTIYRCPKRILHKSQCMKKDALLWRTQSLFDCEV